MTVTVAPEMTPPVWSETVPRMRPKLPWENSAKGNSNTPRIAPSTHVVLLARAVFNTEFIASPFKIETTSPRKWPSLLGKGPILERACNSTLGWAYDLNFGRASDTWV